MAQIMSLLTLQGQLALLMGIGAFLRRIGMVDGKGKKLLTDLVINLVLPFNIIQSFRMSFSWKIMQRTFSILIVSIILQLGCLLLAAYGFRRYPFQKKAVMQYGVVCSNAGFLGNPLAEGIFGSEGLLLASIYLIPQRIVMWSMGIGYFSDSSTITSPEEKRRHFWEVVRKTATHPCIVAVAVGMVLLITQLQLPAFLANTIKSVSNCNTALSMLLIGVIMQEGGFHKMLNKDVIVYCLIRLALIPALVWFGCRVCHVNAFVSGVSVVLAAMPMGGTTAILAAKYGCDATFATKCIAVSTLLSLLTTPVWCLII